MRTFSRIYEPILETAIVRIAGRPQSNYVCRRCLRRKSQLPIVASHFSTSTPRLYAWTDSFKGLGNVLKGDEAPKEDVAKDETKDPEFKPAETWEGLEWIGTKKWYEQQKRPEEAFAGFGPITTPLKDRIEIRDELLKAIIEVFTIRNVAPEIWQEHSREATFSQDYDFPRGIRIGCDHNSKLPIFEFDTQEAEKQFLEQLQRTLGSTRQTNSAMETENVEGTILGDPADIVTSAHTPVAASEAGFTFADLHDQSRGKWSSISLQDLDIRFAIAKRVQQRTGIRLTDPQITHSRTVGAMFLHLWKPEKPKKLAESLMSKEDLNQLPNVKIADHRITIVHREREVGRWKVIEDELTDRGIPPLGRYEKTPRSAKVRL